jgi:hypothetical protein
MDIQEPRISGGVFAWRVIRFWPGTPPAAADVNSSTLQYFVNYNTPDFYLNTSPTMSYNWEADDDEWVIPVGGGIGKIFRFGDTPIDMRISAYKNVEAPDSAPDWFTEFQVKLLFPK